MPPPANKERKANDGASIVTSARRSTRRQKPLLSMEMIANVGSFADYSNGDLMNICLAIGPTDARVVRHVCLRNNVEYLERITVRTVAARKLSKAKEELSAWMEINADWREWMCHTALVNRCCEARYKDEDREFRRLGPFFLFNNPAVAIELGMLDLLKYQVEVIGIDINALRWTGYESSTKINLLLLAVVFNRRACFDYLLSREDLDAGALDGVEDQSMPLWQNAFANKNISADIFQSLVQHPSFDPNRSFVFDHGTGSGEDLVLLPLHFACWRCITLYGTEGQSQRVAKVKILLDAGADPLLVASSAPSAPSSLDIVTRMQAQHNEEAEKVRLCQDLIDMMEEKVAAGK